jgi:CHAT domain-containing protein
VTLAACQSVSGPSSTTEGYLGLHQAFLDAGARQVLVSLWRVDDRATALLMERFYRVLFGSGGAVSASRPPDALREAEALADARHWVRRWRAPDGTTPYAHPVYWAGFVLLCGGGD